jgi:hypothetical protein
VSLLDAARFVELAAFVALAARASRSARKVLRGVSAPAAATAGFSARLSAFPVAVAERTALASSREGIAAAAELGDDSLLSVETLAQPPSAKTPTRGRRGRKFCKVMTVEKTNPSTGWQSLAATSPTFRFHRSFTDAPRSPARIHQSMTPSASERQCTRRVFLLLSLSTVSCFVPPS